MHHAYRGHDIVVLAGNPHSAVIVEHLTGTELPTKITALPGEGEAECLGRARRLIDVYLDALPSAEAACGNIDVPNPPPRLAAG